MEQCLIGLFVSDKLSIFTFFTIFVHFFDTSPISCYFLHGAFFLSCTFIMLHTFHTGFCPCYIFPCFCFIYVTHFVSRIMFILQSSMLCQFHVALFSGYFLFHASFMLHPFKAISSFILHFFDAELVSYCTLC